MRKKVAYTIFTLLVAVAIWYFFVKQHDYQITFNAYHPKGFVYHTIKDWNYNKSPKDSLVKTLKGTPYQSIEQWFKPSVDSIINVEWQLEKVNDTTTEVTGYFSTDQSSIAERTKLLFKNTNFVNQNLEFAKALRAFLKAQSDYYKISSIDTIDVAAKKYLYVERKGITTRKARAMIADNSFVMAQITRNNMKLADFPFVEIQSWDKQTDSISFKFCFPVERKPDSVNRKIKYGERPEFKALRIRFNGNYSKSHFAWYAYDDYFKAQGKENPSILPTEIFLDNPSVGGNELEWRADIVLPLTQSQE
jgi:hypothetical protein